MSGGPSIVIMAGGTGGHIFPALAVAEVLRSRGHAVTWIGTRDGLEARLVPDAGIPVEWIDVRGVRGKGLAALLKSPFMLVRALLQALRILHRLRPRVALGMGGFVSGPGGIAARLSGCPLVLHEQNAVPGLTNRVLSHIASRVMEGFPGSFPAPRHAEYVGNPVRVGIAALPPPTERFADRSGVSRLLVLGGSRGARVLNATLPLAVARLDAVSRPEVWHQTGVHDVETVAAGYREQGIPARVTAFIDDMAEAYAWADLAVCRSGALTIAELTAAGLGAVLVPFAAAVDDHQTRNARFLTQSGAAERLTQERLSAETLAPVLQRLCSDRTRLLSMAMRARTLSRSDAATRVADACLQLGGSA
ncbi:MAG TPA: undecaprenyldiphospho-muramoylpentapeptide beta-N-acetylglucosaminyltransferase [Gammaproteobacteria bacterium]|nr:undecaprenyldiphospho-muramoylpentapeptide beta-N-acetylglucosaminyltransferase [Gammaproteobacteria bacterium]